MLDNRIMRERVKQYADSRGIKKIWFSRILDVHDTTIYNWLSGKYNFTAAKLERLNRILETGV